ncbi:MAG TPA: ATP-binding cassette domain-containing protein [Cytophagales bacterium]|nr:ATP-binding cassette domain-containing protein [Cytophagales bacterium]
MIIEHVSYKNILHDISFDLKGNAICCVIGENGSGKSTLIKILSGYFKEYGGTVTIDQNDLKNLTVQALYKRRAVLTQHNHIQNHIRCRDYIELAANHATADTSVISALLQRLAQDLNISHLLDRDYLICSGGEQQRVNLARVFLQALIHKSTATSEAQHSYIFLDEPFNALDIKHVPLVKRHLQALKDQGFSILIVLHDINLGYELCDDVLFLKEGRVIDFGNKDLVFNTKNLNLTFDLAFEETHAASGKRYFST